MRALTLTSLGGPEHLRVQEVEPPRLTAADQVLVRIQAAALNRLDLFVAGGLPSARLELPHTMGADGAGILEAAGPEVTRFAPGARVMINPGLWCGSCEWCRDGEQSLCTTFRMLGEHVSGTIAEYVAVPERNLAAVPEGWSWAEAAGFSLATLTAWRMLVTRAQLKPGETVLIWGIGGGVSMAAIQIAKLMGARVFATSSSTDKLAQAQKLGADLCFNHVEQNIPAEVRKVTDRRGVEVVVDNVGEKTWEQSLRCLARLGRLVTCGATTGPMCVTDVRKLFWYQWNIMGSTMGSDGEFRRIVELAGQGLLRPVIDSIHPLAEASAAVARLSAAAQTGKIIIEVTRE
ncbi:MAG: zinc-binding dehydrogenase [Gemmatimonadota bacterium]